ncbi:diguanylate cyclase domain-containing protein [Cyanobacterium sp. IPPAS B-1200]|uniref:sensor domain-containing diguanylate cyclase n=1 Tax=Cyanobacterium sp. IPPAS B-1200 TaxID=1562720 RepID=UPI00085263F6|nr:diguanylate cyclase [Cyanobacterium sp. IPPAS B-1200]OEJ78699.1 diguanylate cyclase [Cyanobacterium sp. IPPAS B-1200]
MFLQRLKEDKNSNLFSIGINLMTLILYVAGINASHTFTTLHSEVASLWFPSAITLPLVLKYGIQVFPGITLASIIGLTPSLQRISPHLSFIGFAFIQISCASANCFQPMIAKYVIQRFAKSKDIFINIQSVCIFIGAAIFSPIISAFMGVSALLSLNVINTEEYFYSLVTWWLGSALAHLIFSPTIMQWKRKDFISQGASVGEVVIIALTVLIICSFTFILIYPVEYLLFPPLIWAVFRLKRFQASLLVSIIALIAIVSTSLGYGTFAKDSVNLSLILLQSFTAVISVITLILSAVLAEKQITKNQLYETLEHLEEKVLERTKELENIQVDLQNANKVLEKMAYIDSLTQVANRGCFDKILEQQWDSLMRQKECLSLLLLDVDYFKKYNDFYGHPLGDECLITIAQCLQSVVRNSSDTVARYGGEEFVIILPYTNLEQATVVAEKIQSAIALLAIPHEVSKVSKHITFSIGIATTIPNYNHIPDDLIKKADQALYLAKQQGRNRLKTFDENC